MPARGPSRCQCGAAAGRSLPPQRRATKSQYQDELHDTVVGASKPVTYVYIHSRYSGLLHCPTTIAQLQDHPHQPPISVGRTALVVVISTSRSSVLVNSDQLQRTAAGEFHSGHLTSRRTSKGRGVWVPTIPNVYILCKVICHRSKLTVTREKIISG